MGNSSNNIVDDKVQVAYSPVDMGTALILESSDYNISDRSIANKLYLYDNDTQTETENRRHTRLVVGAEYKGSKYYYPIDFEDSEADKLIEIVRNKKYVFNINSVSGPGYTDKETASGQPSVHLNVNIVEWDMTAGQMGTSGNYYLWTEKREAVLYRDTNSMTSIGVEVTFYRRLFFWHLKPISMVLLLHCLTEFRTIVLKLSLSMIPMVIL